MSAVASPAQVVATPTTVPVLVDVAWLRANLDGVRVVDTRRTADFLDGHVPGACTFPLGSLLVEDTSAVALDRLGRAAQGALAARGIGPDDHVVLVDDADGSAALGAIVCELAGVRAVSVVHGGTGDWARAGHPTTTVPTMHAAVDAAAWRGVAARTEGAASFEQLVNAVSTGAAVLDARSQLEHEGIIGAQCCSGRGCVPGSVHLEWTAFFDMSGAPHPVERVLAIAAHLGLEPTEPVVVTCHAGHRAAIAARILRAAGFADVRVSLGSWHEWSARVLHDDAAADRA